MKWTELSYCHCCVLQSIFPAGLNPPTTCNEPAWAASVISIMGQRCSEKTHCGALRAYGVSTHSKLRGKEDSSQVSNWWKCACVCMWLACMYGVLGSRGVGTLHFINKWWAVLQAWLLPTFTPALRPIPTMLWWKNVTELTLYCPSWLMRRAEISGITPHPFYIKLVCKTCANIYCNVML